MQPSPLLSPALLLLGAALCSTPAAAEQPRDPFRAFERPQSAPGDTPLQRFSLEQLKLRGVVVHTASPRALIEGPDGQSHLARVSDWIGTGWGRIAAINADSVVVVEQYRDPIGGVHQHSARLRLVGLAGLAQGAVSAPPDAARP